CPTCEVAGTRVHLPGTLLVKNSVPGGCAVPKSETIAPRGGIGVDASGHLIVVVVTGEEPSTGLYTYDFGVLMQAFSAVNAVNFDGGGSTVFWWTPGNVPTDPCPACAAAIQQAEIGGNNPRGVVLSDIQLVTDPNNYTIHYSAQTPLPGRPVY